VQSDPRVYLIFWGPNWSGSTVPGHLIHLFHSLAGSVYNNILSQYGVHNDVQLAGAWDDPSPPAAFPNSTGAFPGFTDVFTEVEHAMAVNGWRAGTNNQFMVIPQPSTPINGLGTSFCAFHVPATFFNGFVPVSFIPVPPDNSPCTYGSHGNGTYAATLDATHEYAETATDPDISGWNGTTFDEVGDLCFSYTGFFGPGGEYVPFLWSNDLGGCASHLLPPPNKPIVGMAATADGMGYWMVGADGGIFSFGDAAFYGSMGGQQLNAPIVGMAVTPDGGGYWLVGADGGIFAFGDATYYGSLPAMGVAPAKPIVGISGTSDCLGYWLVAADGGVFALGDAHYYGSMGGRLLNKPMVGIAADRTTGGYWMVAADGGIFIFNAPFSGSMGGGRLNAPMVGIAATPDGGGYWMVGTDGGVFAFGDAGFHGSTGGISLNKPVVGLAVSHSGNGYWTCGADGGLFSFGDAQYLGSYYSL
jgi:hypothetical protein